MDGCHAALFRREFPTDNDLAIHAGTARRLGKTTNVAVFGPLVPAYKLRTSVLQFGQHFTHDPGNGFGVNLRDINVLSCAITADVFRKQFAEPL